MTDDTLPLEPLEPDASVAPLAPDAAPLAAGIEMPRPRTRWAGIVWGLVLGAVAVAGVWLSSGPDRFDDLAAWVQALDAGAAIGYGLLAVGGLLLVGGLVGLLRRAQLTLAKRG